MAGGVCDYGREGRLLRWLVERRNEMGVEMDWRVSKSVHVLVKRLSVVPSFQCTVETTARWYCGI